MDSNLDLLIMSLTSILAAICVGSSLKKLLPTQTKLGKKVFLYFVLYASYTMPSWVGDLNPLYMFPLFISGFLITFAGERLTRLVLGIIFYTLLISLNMLLDSLYASGILNYFLLLIKMLLWCVLAYLLRRITPDSGIQLSKRLLVLLGGLAIGPLMAMLSYSIWGYHFTTDAQHDFYQNALQRLAMTVLPFVIISALALLFATVVLTRHEKLEKENQFSLLREVYYKGLQQEQVQIRTLRHDLSNHITVMQGLLAQGNEDQVSRYLDTLASSPALSGGKRYTENEAANVVLSSKAAQMELLGLIPDFEVHLPKELSIPATELCALLGNALDNAIEGVSSAENRTIILCARLDKGAFMLKVHNAIGGKINADLSSTKANPDFHGYGLSGMREIAMRNAGSLETGIKDGYFELLICFPCKPMESIN